MIIVKLVIMFQFSIAVTLAAILLIIPGALVGPIYGKYNREAVRQHQTAKAKANGHAEDRISNIRTVKAFCDEQGSQVKYKELLAKVFEIALYKGKIWGIFMFSNQILTNMAKAGMILIIISQVQCGYLTIG